MQLGDDAERAEAAHVQLGEVEPGDVLHHAPAGPHDAAVAGDDRAAEHVIAHRTEPLRGAAPPSRWRPPSRCSARGGPADRARATSAARRARAARSRWWRRPAPWRRDRRGSPRPRRRGRACSPPDRRGHRPGARCRVPRCESSIASSCASRQTSASVSGDSGVARGRLSASRSTLDGPSSARRRAKITAPPRRPSRPRAIPGRRAPAAPCPGSSAPPDRTPAAPPAWRRATRRRRSTACSASCRCRRRARR